MDRLSRKRAIVFALIMAFSGCSRQSQHSQPTPQTQYEAVRLKFQQGQLIGAQAEAEDFYHTYTQNPEWSWRFRVLDAEILIWRGMRKDALALLNTELPASLANDEIAVRWKLVQGLANPQYEEAQRCLDEAEHLASSYQPKLLGEVALYRGILLLNHDKDLKAEPQFQRALQIARQESQPFLEASAQTDLGLIAMRKPRYGEAIDWFRSALALSQSLHADALAAKNQGNLGWGYYAMGDLDSALKLFTQAEAFSAQLGLRKDQLRRLVNIGNVYYNRREFEEAQTYYVKALAIANATDDAESAVCLNNLAAIAIENKRFDDAERYNKQASKLKQDNNDHASKLYALYNEAKIDVGRGNVRGAESLFHEVIGRAKEYYVRWEAQAALANLYATAKQPLQAEQQFHQALDTVNVARSSLNREEYRLTFLTNAVSFYNDYIAFLIQEGKIGEALHVAELNRARTLAEGLDLQQDKPSSSSAQFKPEGIARKANTVVLAYWLAPEHSYLWAISPARTALFMLPGESEINQTIENYRRTLAGPDDPREIADASGQKLYEMLVAPAQKLIPPGAHVAIIPSGSLYDLNFETLLAPGRELHYWIEDVVITNASSLLLLRGALAEKRDAADKKLLLIGDPVSPGYPRLGHAADEISEVKKYFPADLVQAYISKDATARAYLDGSPQDFSLIHFVAHGTASRESPLDSAVILSGDESSYKLYARDIVAGKRLHAKLVTISSCEGASGKTYAGEGLVGLSWAFLRAGAHEVVAALWDVNDASTAQFMDRFYGEINAGKDPAVALRTAKLSMLHSDNIYRRPFYWAPFQLYKGL